MRLIMSPITTNLQGVYRARDAAIMGRSARFSRAVEVVAVSKTKSAHDVEIAFDAGQRIFGENYVQEAVDKIHVLSDLRTRGIEWHLIGPLQSNKAKLAALNFDWVQTVDRIKIAEALSRHRMEAGLPALNILVQINVSGELTKSGVSEAGAPALAGQVAKLPGIRLRGVMSIVENTPDEAALRGQFRVLRRLFEELQSQHPGVDTLSMGMSGDFAIAIEEGATMVRVGSLIFGSRAPDAPEVQTL